MNKTKFTKNARIKIGIFIFLFIMLFNFMGAKLGFEKGSSSLDPSTWGEYLSQLPLFLIIAAIISYVVIYLMSKSSMGTNFYMCTKCLESTMTQDKNNTTCAKCNGLLEPLDGFYERHPDLKND